MPFPLQHSCNLASVHAPSAWLDSLRRLMSRLFVRRASMTRVVAHQVIVFVAVLLMAIQLVTFTALNWAVSDNARKSVQQEIEVGHRIFSRVLEDRAQQLTTSAGVLAADFGLRQVLLSGDTPTIVSALDNHAARIGAAKMMVVGRDGAVMASTGRGTEPAPRERFAYPRLIGEAEKNGSAAAIVTMDHGAYQLVVVPVLAPVPVAWIVVAFRVDGKLARDLGMLTGLDVSFATWEQGRGWELAGTTLSQADGMALVAAMTRTGGASAVALSSDLLGDTHGVTALPLTSEGSGAAVGILQRSLHDAISRFDRLRGILLALAAFGLFATVAGSLFIARSISRPVSVLAEFARRMESGDYERGPPETRSDELGSLAASFNRMRLAIAAREQQIKALALQDALTGLPNRALFNERLVQAIGAARRMNVSATVLLIDLNRFKQVNDTLGHHAGDVLLCHVATRLDAVLARATDTAARLGGDEFGVLLPGSGIAEAEATARKIVQAFAAPVLYDGHELEVGGSIGIASFPEHGDEPHVLMSHADAAMYAAKRGNLGCAIYDAALANGAANSAHAGRTDMQPERGSREEI